MTTSRSKQAPRHEKPLPVYAVYGGDPFLQQQALSEITRVVLGGERDNMAFVEFDGPTAALADVLDECRSMSLLSPVRLVCVRDADEFITNFRKELEKYLEVPSPTGVLVLVCTRWDAGWNLYKRVEQVGGNISCRPPKPWNVPEWVVGHAKDVYGCDLPMQAAKRLTDLAGYELGRLDMELAKLSTYIHPRTAIRTGDIEELVGATREEKVFGIIDAIASRQPRQALVLWDQVLGTDPQAEHRSIGGLAYGFRKLGEMKRLLGQGLSAAEAAKQVGDSWHAGELKTQAERFSLPQWQEHLVKLLQIDVAAKTGLGTVRSAVEKLIVELCAAP
ncbi:MAG TPA: DNA polymerase III subunit delta [Phycisphaerae bacterium]|nr:DNA polymerase III subunit delta [Phycisphaerae bacterium]